MMRDYGASAFIDNGRMWDAFGIAHVHDVPDDVVGVFLKRIIGRAVEITARAVVIDAETAANIEISEIVTELGKFCVIPGGFAHRAFDRGDVGDLRPDVKMNQLEAMSEARFLQHLAGGNEIGRVEAELGVLAAAR